MSKIKTFIHHEGLDALTVIFETFSRGESLIQRIAIGEYSLNITDLKFDQPEVYASIETSIQKISNLYWDSEEKYNTRASIDMGKFANNFFEKLSTRKTIGDSFLKELI